MGDYSGWFENIAPILAIDGCQVYALDLRGFGESQEKDQPKGHVKDFGRHLNDIDEFITYLAAQHEGGRIFLFGHSLGGLYGIWYAANYPGKVEGLILAAPALTSSLNKPKNSIHLFLANKFTPNKVIHTHVSVGSPGRDPEEIKIMQNDPLEATELTVNYLSNVRSILLKNANKYAHQIKTPVLIIQGNADQTVLACGAEKFYKNLASKDKQFELLSDAGHWFHDALCPAPPRAKCDPEKRAQFINLVKNWLKTH